MNNQLLFPDGNIPINYLGGGPNFALQNPNLVMLGGPYGSSLNNTGFAGNLNFFNITGGEHGEQYNLEDFLKDIKVAIVDVTTGLKEVRDRLTALEGRCKLDFA